MDRGREGSGPTGIGNGYRYTFAYDTLPGLLLLTPIALLLVGPVTRTVVAPGAGFRALAVCAAVLVLLSVSAVPIAVAAHAAYVRGRSARSASRGRPGIGGSVG